MTLCNDTVINEDKLLGDPTETALVAYAQKIGVDVVELNKLNKRIDEIPFDSKKKIDEHNKPKRRKDDRFH